MAVYTLKKKQNLPVPLEKAWNFFSSPANLREITPEYMDFRITSDPEFLVKAYPGQIITYFVRPILGIPLFWMTEITHVQNLQFFVDEQRVGPYSIWHHEHHFREIPGGVEMTDLITYRLPLGPLGDFAHWLFVKKQLQEIFEFRAKTIAEYFGRPAK